MFLVEKLPREHAETSDQPAGERWNFFTLCKSEAQGHTAPLSPGKLMVLQKSIAAAIRAQLSVPWLPSNCRLPPDGGAQVTFPSCTFTSLTAHLRLCSFTHCKHQEAVVCTDLRQWCCSCTTLIVNTWSNCALIDRYKHFKKGWLIIPLIHIDQYKILTDWDCSSSHSLIMHCTHDEATVIQVVSTFIDLDIDSCYLDQF